MAELLGGVPTVTALGEMVADIGQQLGAAPQGNVEQPVVEAAFDGRREVEMRADALRPELLAGLVQTGGRGDGVDTQQTSRYGYRLGLDLAVPQQTLRGHRKGLESAFGEPPPFRCSSAGGAQSARSDGSVQLREFGGNSVRTGPFPDHVTYDDQELGPQRTGGPVARETGEQPVHGRGGHELGRGAGGGEADGGVVLCGAPVPGQQQRDGAAVVAGRDQGGENTVGFARRAAGARRI
ncbi:hypothetical protein [Streptomyces sp. bgisy154]|uniref:hypothetical protein n=1 Tax=Streptomyces sp. bgisy154 TaxID=3413794 RepID=UPI003D725784